MSYSTQQREALKEVLRETKNPLSAVEIHELGKLKKPSLGMATVYRTLKTMEQEGVIDLVDIPGTVPHYELGGHRHHHHFFCETCKRVFELEGCVHEVEELAPKKFQVHRHEIILYGACEECVKK
ncbi:MAG: transcriptional repressor [Blastochloris sp.]|nr:transcriptional repressor [Blastochloris sp.]